MPQTSPQEATSLLLGADLGSNHIRIGAVDETGKVLAFRREPYTFARDDAAAGRALADKLISVVHRMFDEQSAHAAIKAVGVGFPGLVHHASQRIVKLPHTPSLADIDLHQEFARAFNVPVHFENNANAAAYAELRCGAARGVGDFLYLHIGAGVGAGLVIDGKLRHGTSGFAGEIGHMNFDPEGLECDCGNRGCLETMVSAGNIVRRTRERLRRDSTSSLSRLGAMGGFTYDDIITAADTGDDLARIMLQRTGTFIGRTIADVLNLLNLSMVAVGGAPAARRFLVPAITEEVRQRAFAPEFDDCRIVAAELGAEAGVIGAALLAGKAQ